MTNVSYLPRPLIDCKIILESKSTHPKCVNFDGVRVRSILFAFKSDIAQCGNAREYLSNPGNWSQSRPQIIKISSTIRALLLWNT